MKHGDRYKRTVPMFSKGPSPCFLQCLRGSGVFTLRQVIVLPLNDAAFLLCLRDIQMRRIKSVLLPHPRLNLFVCSTFLESGHVHVFQIEFHSNLLTIIQKGQQVGNKLPYFIVPSPIYFRLFQPPIMYSLSSKLPSRRGTRK